MAAAREQSQRRHALAQAAVFFAGEATDLEDFIRTGHLDGRSEVRIPYSPEVMQAWARGE